ncbi:MAG: hypothetical protein Tp178MES00d2C33159851_157 [Prokaryotic dsDNA virus sp.]|nr:MAG: hypothetical protein Tp178MES00d2C33159851_157 [Prokaryotic dsDNA virus sp.]|tara:strand:- start:6473 stop:6640 length:168 start_codon:yes stop_codon:yes gene_type:complete
MSMYTKEQFEEYKGNKHYLVVKYYTEPEVGYHETYEEYVEYFNYFYGLEEEQSDN